ncbi:hypothetical protein F441_16112 [Phytophthora nicotianae CJ01A1]|uniref:Uncharacterized protein n=1 Tax=Phytophthora nicotianae CJ01A1 TaxID=1317063 RepID=W2WB04_PHYNI|nr:hypothetical protein F441_16112 [Phytophthora nicotianae CJ01A1]
MRLDLARELSSHFKRFQPKVAAAVSRGQGQIKVGKDPMSLGLYKRIAMEMLLSPSRDMVFARTFMVLSWNLMSRAANTASICYGHLEWREDALCVYFAHMKNDQRGSRPRDRATCIPIRQLLKYAPFLRSVYTGRRTALMTATCVYSPEMINMKVSEKS